MLISKTLPSLHLSVFACAVTTTTQIPAETTTTQTSEKQTSDKSDWRYVSNDRIRVGVKMSSGAAIGWISESRSEQNFVNHFDRGRLIQQSYYGDADGSIGSKKTWHWNPVQGGHYLGRGAKVLELTSSETKLYAKSTPVHWATGGDMPDCLLEQTIGLNSHVAHIHYRFSYSGRHTHAAREQEIPAVFLEPEFR
jgi:hypothetical protein